jgi:hypothetical protein
MHDLDLVAFSQYAVAVVLSRDDLAVHFHGDPSLVESELAEQIRYGQACGQRLCLAVDDHVHARTIVISGYLYNFGTIW